MAGHNKDRLLMFLVGLLAGGVSTVIGGVVLYKVVVAGDLSGDATYNQVKKGIKKVVRVLKPKPESERFEEPSKRSAPEKLKEGFDVFAASSMDRIFKDGATVSKPHFTESVTLSSAGHEYESFQIVVKNGRDILKAVRLELTDIVHNKTGVVIDRKNITWRVVGYVPTEKPYYDVKYVGLWPDPLIPADATEVNPGITQPFWVTVYIPKETAAGLYTGKIKVITENVVKREIPLSVNVYDFILPRENSLKTAFDFYGHETKKRYPQWKNEMDKAYAARINTLNGKFIIEMLKNRMNPVLNVDPTSDNEMAAVDRYRWFGLNNFSIGKRGGTLGNNWPKSSEELEKLLPLYRTYGEMLALNKMLDYQYIYTWDEGKIGNPQVPKVTSMIKRAYPKLKNMVCYHGFWDPEKFPGWGDYIDIWCFQISKFNKKKMDVLKNRGMEIWMYVSGPSNDGTPNLAMDFDSVDYRIIPWMNWKYDWKGFLYWCVNWWVKVDPFKSAANTKWAQNGNGLLFYPGEHGPISSLRVEIFRDGMEDYEYLVLLKNRTQLFAEKGLEARHPEITKTARAFLEIDPSLIESTRSFVKDGSILENRRNDIADMIERINNIMNSQNN